VKRYDYFSDVTESKDGDLVEYEEYEKVVALLKRVLPQLEYARHHSMGIEEVSCLVTEIKAIIVESK
jgi:hypothetical protein